MSAIFEEMDRLAAEKYGEAHEVTLDIPPCDQRTGDICQQSVEELTGTTVDQQHREASDMATVWDTSNYRSIPTPILMAMLRHHPKEYKFAVKLFQYMLDERHNMLKELKKLLGVQDIDLVELYALALHERAIKYRESKCECGLHESDLLHRAWHHLCKLVDGDSSIENHRAHLTWCVISLVLQKVTEFYRELEDA